MDETMKLPATQLAVQLVGPDSLRMNLEKPVLKPGPHAILAQTEAVGLCFSDMKLLKQFDQHVRKGEIVSGISAEALSEMPNYVPGGLPTVPGHEVVCRVLEVGDQVEHYRPGQRWIIQADYRNLKTAGSNGAFGYDFEGGLQQYILLDERVIGDPSEPNGYMIPVGEGQSRSQAALVEPWACVENSYATPERNRIRAGGRLLVVGGGAHTLDDCFDHSGGPSEVVRIADEAGAIADLPDEAFDDIVYFGANAESLELLNDKLAKGGILNVVLGGKRIGRPVNLGVGRIHYGGTRWVGTVGSDPAAGYAMIPTNGELRTGDHVLVVGAGGPMGQMHVIRALAFGAQTTGSDVDLARLSALEGKAAGLPGYRSVASKDLGQERFSYIALMAPIPALAADAIARCEEGGIVNLFAGIPAPVKHPLDLDALIEKRVFVFGTSGSEPADMRTVLGMVVSGHLDTNLSVGAVSGMAGAIDGLMAVEARTMDGKIVVYPQLANMPLTALEDLADRYPTVAAKLDGGRWTRDAEDELLRIAD